MIRLDTFTIFFSWKCTFACAHCGFSCGPGRTGRLTRSEALAAIEEVSLNRDLQMIAYSGGEPFLFYDDMLECMRRAHGKGLKAGAVTNCYWAKQRDIAEKRLHELASLGLDELIISLDDYHLEFVPVRNIRRVVHAAMGHGVRVGVNVLVSKSSRVRREDLPGLLEIPAEKFNDPTAIWVREFSPVLSGRARTFFRRSDLRQYGETDLIDKPCYFVVRNMILAPDHSVYSCCGFGDASEQGPASLAYVGELGPHSFKELYRRASGNLVFNLLASSGPYRLLKLVEESDPAIRFRRRYVSNCDVCGEISTNAALRKALGRALRNRVAVLQRAPEERIDA